jgi:2-oxoisovalerate dehydrogenase E1 component beta subunit
MPETDARMGVVTLVEAIRQALDEELARDERVVLIGQDIGARGGVFRVTDGLLEKFGEKRVIEAPLSISAQVGVAVGMALYGLLPVVEIQAADILAYGFHQIVNEAARMCYRSNGVWQAPLVIRAPYGGGVGGGLYESQSVEAFFTHVPGLKVIVPSSPYDAKGLLKAAIRDPNPVLFLEARKGYRNLRGKVPGGDYYVTIGSARVSRPGKDVSVYAYGMMHTHVLRAADLAARRGVEAEVVDLRTLAPLDRETVLTSVQKTGKALIVHEDNLTGGYGAELAALIAEEAFTALDAPVRRLATSDSPAAPFSRSLQENFYLTPEKIAAAILSLAAY